MHQERLPEAGQQDHGERAQLDRTQLGRDQAPDGQGQRAREDGHERKNAEHYR